MSNRRASILTGNHPEQDFQSELISGCFSNPSLCFVSWIFPCWPVAQTTTAIEGGSTIGNCIKFCLWSFVGCGCVPSYNNRQMLRASKNVPGTKLNDLLLSVFCAPCVIIQNAKESDAYLSGQGELIERI